MDKDLIPLMLFAMAFLLCIPAIAMAGIIIALIVSRQFRAWVSRKPNAFGYCLLALGAMFGGGVWLLNIMFKGWI